MENFLTENWGDNEGDLQLFHDKEAVNNIVEKTGKETLVGLKLELFDAMFQLTLPDCGRDGPRRRITAGRILFK